MLTDTLQVNVLNLFWWGFLFMIQLQLYTSPLKFTLQDSTTQHDNFKLGWCKHSSKLIFIKLNLFIKLIYSTLRKFTTTG